MSEDSKIPLPNLDGTETSVGSHPASDIFVDDITVSRRHLTISREGGIYTLRVVGSLNGTYVNKERCDAASLQHGDEIQIGRYRLTFVERNERPRRSFEAADRIVGVEAYDQSITLLPRPRQICDVPSVKQVEDTVGQNNGPLRGALLLAVHWSRVDDVLNVAGHRLSTMEIESALVANPMVAEAAVVGRPDEVKGQAVSAFVTLKSGQAPSEENKNLLRQWVAKEIGPIAKPDDIRFTDSLPKTRSGKIMRRLLRELATNGEVKGDTTTLEDFSVLAKLSSDEE